MRPLKLRAWDCDDKKWMEFNAIEFVGGRAQSLINWLPDSHREMWLLWGGPAGLESQASPDNPHTNIIIEQYTGLKDKNGKEIWEGDLVRCGANDFNPGKVYKVVYSLHGFVYVRDDEPDQTSYYGQYITEVIGNIHEHSGNSLSDM